MPARPCASRTENGNETEQLLADWERLVVRAESGTAAVLTGCPQCDGFDGLASRDQLEVLIHRGGRRGVRVARRVRGLDDRYERATTPLPNSLLGGGWWHHRNLD